MEVEYVESEGSDEPERTRDFDLEGADDDQYSYILKSARSVLLEKHPKHEKTAWNVSSGRVIGDIAQTPPKETWGMRTIEPEAEHSDCLPSRMAELLTKATQWIDVTSLSPPDGKFETALVDAVKVVAEHSIETGNTIIIRMLFGNIIGMPVDCDALIETFTKDLPPESNIKLWMGSWRKGLSWNHSKIIAIDGEHLLTGGHNLWDDHYLKTDPVHDISIEMRGKVAHDGHLFANKMWEFIKNTDKGLSVTKWFPDWVPLPKKRRVGVSQWPKRLSDYPPMYAPLLSLKPPMILPGREVPVLSMGRYGHLHKDEAQANPSDSAITAMIYAAKRIIKLSLQDFGPLCLPGIPGPTSIPGGVWPKEYLKALALGIYRDLDVEVVLSNPNSVPGKLSPATANYGNGWTCVDVACEIIRAIKDNVEDIEESRLLDMVRRNLRVTMLRTSPEKQWEDGENIGNHAKFFIIDDRAFYIGSQNLYIANLAEWGLLIDDEEETMKVLEEYWNPLWSHSYDQEQWEQEREEVLPGLNVDRSGGNEADASDEYRQLAAQALHSNMKAPGTRDDSEVTKWYGW